MKIERNPQFSYKNLRSIVQAGYKVTSYHNVTLYPGYMQIK